MIIMVMAWPPASAGGWSRRPAPGPRSRVRGRAPFTTIIVSPSPRLQL